MDLTSIFVPVGAAAAITLAIVLSAGWFFLRRVRQLLPTTPVVDIDAAPALNILQDRSCEGCKSFNLHAGQRLMHTQPAFAQASQHLEPWQMARKRRVDFDPRYLEIEKAMFDAQNAGQMDIAEKMRAQLMTIDPGELEDDTSDVSQAMMELDWTRLGLCGLHKELRFETDCCPKFEANA